jgi:putative ABC transport system permease protein
MNWLKQIISRRRLHSDLSEEIRAHLEEKTDELMEAGMSREEAAARARKEFGNVTAIEESGREVWQWPSIENLLADIRFGVRLLRKSPAFTFAAVLTLALGIGANSAMFSVIDSVLIRPLPYKDPASLVMLWEHSDTGDQTTPPFDYLAYERQNQVFSQMAGINDIGFNLSGIERPIRIYGAIVTPDFFSIFGTPAQIGRTFSREDAKAGGPRLVVISYGLWQRQFEGNAAMIGQTIILDEDSATVVGVMPAGFDYPFEAEAWMLSPYAVPTDPLKTTEDPSFQKDHTYFDVIGRIKPGLSIAQAKASLDTLSSQIVKENPKSGATHGVFIETLQENYAGDFRQSLLVVFGAVVLILLIACANVASLLLARAVEREREISLRIALGASRVRLFRQLLTESLLLGALGTGLGMALAYFTFAPLTNLIPVEIRHLVQFQLDSRALLFTAAASLITTILFGSTPAFLAASRDVQTGLKEGAPGSSAGPRRNRLRSAFVVTETALALLLLAGAGLLICSFAKLQMVNKGFDPAGVFVARLSLPVHIYPDSPRRIAFMNEALRRIREIPGVTSAGVVSRLPLARGSSSRGIEIEGRPPDKNELEADYSVVSPGFFETLRIPLLRGRYFNESDTADSPHVAVITKAMADLYWPGKDAIGRHFGISGYTSQNDLMEVVGITGDIKQHNLARTVLPEFFVPYSQDPWTSVTLAVRSSSDPATLSIPILDSIRAVDTNQPLFHAGPYLSVVTESSSNRRFAMVLLALFAGIALILASGGIYGLISYSVAQRRHEIGIRLAIGAKRRDVLWLVVAEGLKLACAGILIGTVAAFGLAQLIRGMLYGTSASDPLVMASVPLIIVAVTVLACCLPAVRAMRVDPMTALRYE